MASSVSGSWCSWISVWPMSYKKPSCTSSSTRFLSSLRTVSLNRAPSWLIHALAGLEALVPGRQRQAVGAATAVAGEHENGVGFAPDFQLFQRADGLLLIQGGHGHGQCRRPAGKLRRLGVVGHRQEFPGRLVIQNAPFRSEERRVGKECGARGAVGQ